MEKVTTKRLALYSGRTHPELAHEVATHLNIELGHDNLVEFANGEIRCRFGESIRGSDVFVIQSHYGIDDRSVNDSIMEHLIMIDAAYRASAKRITAVCPFYGYARQDRKAEGREPITARLVADMFKAAGAKRMISIDLHSGQIQGFFDGPVDHLTAMPVLEGYLRTHAKAPVIVSPDAGRIKVAERMAQHLGDCGADLAFIYKRRPKGTANVAEATEVMGDVAGRLCVITDDMIDTAGTICAAAELLMERGAREVWAMATHGVLSGPAIDRLKNSPLERIVLTNTLPLPSEKQLDKIEVLSVAPLIAEALGAVFDDTSVSDIFDGENARLTPVVTLPDVRPPATEKCLESRAERTIRGPEPWLQADPTELGPISIVWRSILGIFREAVPCRAGHHPLRGHVRCGHDAGRGSPARGGDTAAVGRRARVVDGVGGTSSTKRHSRRTCAGRPSTGFPRAHIHGALRRGGPGVRRPWIPERRDSRTPLWTTEDADDTNRAHRSAHVSVRRSVVHRSPSNPVVRRRS